MSPRTLALIVAALACCGAYPSVLPARLSLAEAGAFLLSAAALVGLARIGRTRGR
jgi:hypothetical protein